MQSVLIKIKYSESVTVQTNVVLCLHDVNDNQWRAEMIKNSLQAGNSTGIFLDRYTWHIHQYAVTLVSRIQRWNRNAKTRKHLVNLPPYLYQDIGLTDRQVRNEIRKNFWD